MKNGAKFYMSGSVEIFESMPVENGFPRLRAMALTVIAPYQLNTHCPLVEEWVSSAARRLGAGGAKLLELNDLWSVSNHTRFLVQSRHDYVHSCGKCQFLSIKNSCMCTTRDWMAEFFYQVRRCGSCEN
jgi:hypothetical protein